jgi:tetratricopeptide (TPR) repeat protein
MNAKCFNARAQNSQSGFSVTKQGLLGTRGPVVVLLGCLLALVRFGPVSLVQGVRGDSPKELTKEERNQLIQRAEKLDGQAVQLYQQGKFAEATKLMKQALAMRQRLYPKAQYPQGHPDLADSLNNLGVLLREQGEYAAARDYHRQALAMYQRLYPKPKYPRGHSDLALSGPVFN